MKNVGLINIHVLTAFLSCMGLGVVFMNIPPVLPELKMTYGVTYARIGLLATSIIFAHAAVQIPSGLLTDIIGPKKSLLLSLSLILIANLLCIFNNHFNFVLCMRIISGIGTGFAFLAGMKYAALYTSEENRGLVQGFFGGAFSIGAILPFLLMPIMVKIDSRLIYLTTAAFFMIPIFCLLIWGVEVHTQSGMRLAHFKPIFKNKDIWMLGILHAIFFSGVLTLSTWFSAFFTSMSNSESLSMAGAWGAVMMFISAVARVTGGALVKCFAPFKILMGSFLVLVVSYLMLCWTDQFILLLFFFGLAIYVGSVTFGLIFFLSSAASKMEFAASGFGIVNCVANIVSFLLPIFFGYLIDLTGSFTLPFLFMGGFSVCGAALVLLWRKRLSQDG
jgi:nitrate/nitrite transporter NarK